MPQGRAIYQSWDDITVTAGACTNSSQLRCPQNFEICADSFIECQMISESCYGQDLAKPFRCRGALEQGVSIQPYPPLNLANAAGVKKDYDDGWQEICVAKIDDCCGSKNNNKAASKPPVGQQSYS